MKQFLDASTEFLFGESMDSLLPDTPVDSDLFIRSFDYAMIGLGRRVRLGILKFLYWDKKWYESTRIVHEQVEKYIDGAIAQQQQGEKSMADLEKSDMKVPERYILLNEMAKQTQDRDDLRSQILAVFMPGRDSTGYALSNVIHILARRPEIYQKLREEVMSVGHEPLTFELLKSMKYTQWVINEGEPE